MKLAKIPIPHEENARRGVCLCPLGADRGWGHWWDVSE